MLTRKQPRNKKQNKTKTHAASHNQKPKHKSSPASTSLSRVKKMFTAIRIRAWCSRCPKACPRLSRQPASLPLSGAKKILPSITTSNHPSMHARMHVIGRYKSHTGFEEWMTYRSTRAATTAVFSSPTTVHVVQRSIALP